MTLLSNGYTLLLLAMIVGTEAQQYKTDRTYPDYCTTDSQHTSFKIPKLDRSSEIIGDPESLKLLHVTGVIRHGARAPVARHECWPSYLDEDTDTAEWDCSLNTLTSTPSNTAIEVMKSKSLEFGEKVSSPADLDDITFSSGETPSFIYEKRYDANFSPSGSDHFPDNLGDHLQGTCQLGQLTLRGYEQQRENGIIFRDAYVKSSSVLLNENRNPLEILYDFDEEINNDAEGSRAYDEPDLYFRSDDDQRTIMSGQALLGEMFGDLMTAHSNKLAGVNKHNPVIRVHTSDRDRDFLAPNHEICPRLDELENDAKESEAYLKTFFLSDEARTMNEFADEYLGGFWRYSNPGVAMDCFMTTACSDRSLPFALDHDKSNGNQNIRDRFGSSWIERWTQFHTEKEAYKYTYNGFKYAQVVTNPIWNDIMGGLLAFTNADKHEMSEAWPDLRPGSKLSLYSAHDSTLMALLASLGPKVWDGTEWPAYASMFLIELYEINFDSYPQDSKWEVEEEFPTRVVFRLIYNGEVLTNKISGCPPNEEVCDLDILIIHVFRFSNVSEWDQQCEALEEDTDEMEGIGYGEEDSGDEDFDNENYYKDDSRVPDTIFLVLGCGIIFGSAGAFGMYIYLTKESMKQDQMDALNNSLDLHQVDPETSPSVEMSPTRKDNYALTPQSDAIMT